MRAVPWPDRSGTFFTKEKFEDRDSRRYTEAHEMMDGGMMPGMGLIWLIVLVLVLLAIIALIKFTFFR
jgi:hypothetical protein